MNKWRKIWSCWGIICLLLFAMLPPASASNTATQQVLAENGTVPRVLTVAFPESRGINEVYSDGTYGGMTYDWLHEIAKYTGWEYRFVTAPADELLTGMMNGEYDLMGGMFYMEGYEKYFNYPNYLMGSNYSLLIFPQNDDTIKSFDLTTLNGKRIGVYAKANSKIERLLKFLSFNNLSCQLVYYENVADYEACLDKGEVDLLYGSDVYMQANYNVAAKLESDPYYLITAHDEPELCAQLSEAMSAIYTANPNFSAQLYSKYFPEEYINSINFSAEELAYISKSQPIRTAVIRDRYPLMYEEEGVTRGIVPACLALISERTGLRFTYVFTDTYDELPQLVQSGQADIIGCYMNGDHSADLANLVSTAPFISLDSVLLRNKQADFNSESLVMAVPAGRDLKPRSSNDIIVYYSHYLECLEAIDRGDADYTQIPASFVEDYYAKDYYANVTLLADVKRTEQMTLALSKPFDVRLYTILNKAVNSLTETELGDIVAQNVLAARPGAVTMKTLFYSNPILIFALCLGFVVLISLVVLLTSRYKMKSSVMQLRLEKAEETSRAKSDFLSRMSHEIRTPMNAIIGLTNLAMLTEDATPATKENLQKIDSSAKFLLSLLNDILDMSKMESEKMQLDIAPFDLDAITNQLENMFALQAQCKHISLQFDSAYTESLYLGDALRLSQVLTNLLSNACKFTNDGGAIAVSINENWHDNQRASLLFCVKDNGIGIKEEDLERIFFSFEQADNRDHSTPGTGLGLSISRSLVALMGGELRVESQYGQGSTFYFTIELPIYHGDLSAKASTESQRCSLAGLTVLLAEDNDINAEIASELLQLEAINVQRAANGQEAVQLFVSSAQGSYDLILMDINMPVMDGLAATRAIRSADHPDAQTIPILAMTANTFQEDRDQAAAAGMTGFLPKPFDVEQLYQALRQATQAE